MMKQFLLLVLVLAALASPAWGGGLMIGSGVVDHCSSQAWATLANFKLDFDHPDDSSTACLSSGSRTGTATGSPTISNPTLTTAGIGSGGNSLIIDATNEYLTYSNTTNEFYSKWGEIIFKIRVTGNNTGGHTILSITGYPYQNYFNVILQSTGEIKTIWEDNNDGGFIFTSSLDVDSYYSKWIQVDIKFDTTRCTDGVCDGAGEDELCIRYRVDNNSDGDFNDGGVEDWSSWACKASSQDMNIWDTEPTTNSIRCGIIDDPYSVEIDFDDLEISNTQPAW